MTEELACRAHVFAASVYWDPAHKCYRVAAQLPKGEPAPDLNGLVSLGGVVNLHRCHFEPSPLTGRKVDDALARRLSGEHTERVPGLSQESLASLPNNDSDGLEIRDRNNEITLGHKSLPNRAKAARQE